ncbi:LANO_0G10968g1_1 [Lachancea nothofagi CBS 11611]|uniref:LANO_0G10968g1_1 n=1 Tax=Lachancea nothofagi CBS 11611 TaxID=1266666 RepID=A0A1G4KJ28_9SACH|nr:LANO_0G10968g1_1 [Lachancea nothofagi CBS 11611]
MSGMIREAAKQLVRSLEKLPEERVKHIVSLKGSQLERYKYIAGLETGSQGSKQKPSLQDIKDIINRTSGPLGLQKDTLKKAQDVIPEEQFTAETIQEQAQSLNTILSNKYRDYYSVGDKLLKPQGNPVYYQRLMDEIEGKKKETFWTAMRTVVLGK